ncbi:AfsR/SARP family transcriptional regulator [Micromonospora coxensis]|uniref:AfsR/SARP family transcriptional regulator n=1 Tax=Micromonospora coxensis TaxID=356852 RepID=UPI00341B8E27
MRGHRIGVRGRIELSVDGVAASLARLERAFAASLAAHQGRIVSVDRLIDGLWPSDPPTGARNRVQAIIASVRRSATPELIVTRTPGYQLTAAVVVDATEFTADVQAAATGRFPRRGRPAARLHRRRRREPAARRRTCRCFGRTAAPLGRQHLWRNVFLVGCAVAGLLAPAGPVRPGEAVLAVAAGLVTGVLIVMLDELRYLFGASERSDTGRRASAR